MSAVVAAIPILVLFFMLGVIRKPAWMAAISALAAAFLLARSYRMPVQLAVMSTIAGAAYGIFPIAWIVFSSILSIGSQSIPANSKSSRIRSAA